MKKKIKKLEKANDTLKSKSDRLQVEKAVNKAKLAELDSNLTSRINKEQASTTALKSEINSLKSTNKTKLQTLESAHKIELQTLKDANKTVKDANTTEPQSLKYANKTELKIRDERISALKQDNNCLKSELQRRSKQLDDITQTQYKTDLHLEKEKKRMKMK